MSLHMMAGRFACRHFYMFHFQVKSPKMITILFKIWLKCCGLYVHVDLQPQSGDVLLTLILKEKPDFKSLQKDVNLDSVPDGVWDVAAWATRTNPKCLKCPFALNTNPPLVGSNRKWAEQAESSRAPSILLIESRAHKKRSSVENWEWPSKNAFQSLKSASSHFSGDLLLFCLLEGKTRHDATRSMKRSQVTQNRHCVPGSFCFPFCHLKVCI